MADTGTKGHRKKGSGLTGPQHSLPCFHGLLPSRPTLKDTELHFCIEKKAYVYRCMNNVQVVYAAVYLICFSF